MIDVRNITFRYPGTEINALDGLSIEIPDGSFVAVMGGNGSGKSTLARSLNGLLSPTSGEVLVDGWNTSDEESRRSIRRRIGMVFQNPHLQITSVTVEREVAFGLQNIGCGSTEIRARIDDQLRAMGLEQLRHCPPWALSGGEQQRLALAAVLAMRPAHLVLDEATSLLSPSSRESLLRIVSEERTLHGTTLVLITQFAEEALKAERLVVLRGGRIFLDGEPGSVFTRCSLAGATEIPVPLHIRANRVP